VASPATGQRSCPADPDITTISPILGRAGRLAAEREHAVPSAYDESEHVEQTMKFGEAGDSLSLARVIAAMIVAGAALGAVGYLFDLVVGPAINMRGWWVVFFTGGIILGGMLQAVREFAVPGPAEQRALAAEARARASAEPPADDAVGGAD
jgi:hypothetical protein